MPSLLLSRSCRFFFLLLAPAASVMWEAVSSLPCSGGCGRHHPVTFSNGKRGYVGLGNNAANTNFGDFFRFENGQWTGISDYPLKLGFSYGVSSYGVSTTLPTRQPDHAYVGFGKCMFTPRKPISSHTVTITLA